MAMTPWFSFISFLFWSPVIYLHSSNSQGLSQPPWVLKMWKIQRELSFINFYFYSWIFFFKVFLLGSHTSACTSSHTLCPHIPQVPYVLIKTLPLGIWSNNSAWWCMKNETKNSTEFFIFLYIILYLLSSLHFITERDYFLIFICLWVWPRLFIIFFLPLSN